MKNSKDELLEALHKLRARYPDWRLGQLVCNVTVWAKGTDKNAIWDLEDSEFIKAAKEHLQKIK
jgi:hypothetical protein